MSKSKRVAIGAVVCLFATSVALAASAHFLKCSKSAQGNNLVVSFKEAGQFMFAVAKEDDAAHVLKDTARQVINKVLHREDAD